MCLPAGRERYFGCNLMQRKVLARRVQKHKRTQLKIGSPGRFGIDAYTLGWPMGARILGHADAAPALDTVDG